MTHFLIKIQNTVKKNDNSVIGERGGKIAFKHNIKIILKQKKLHTFDEDNKYFLRIYLKVTD